MEILFHGKRALVTGAGKGIGRALTLKLAECGAEVVAVSRTQSDLDALKKESPKIQPLCLDISNWELTKNALKSVGPIDLLVNNAGIMEPKEYGTYTEQDCDKTFNINVKAIVNIGQMIADGMKTRGKGGAIVNVSSVMGFTVAPGYGVYCASKGAVDQLTRSMAVEFGPCNVSRIFFLDLNRPAPTYE
ncbi:L-xylulose reductase [Araneus ventricosus]|uniref:L-xylulose reductase n=1 Tax=Araneus ventricosus TaxID=182803 RepID=A0A4Y2G4G3_ARAVE|nr:L-xylulose reductase [Araneus ventricosus]